MVDPVTLPDEPRQALERLGTVDVVLGIPSFNNADTIEPIVRAGAQGLQALGPALKGVIINADLDSTDGTRDHLQNLATDNLPLIQVPVDVGLTRRLSMPYHGMPGHDVAARTILSLAGRLNARACVLVGPNKETLSPEAIGRLLTPVLEHDFDLVVPRYHRHKLDGTLTSGLVYPLTRSLYGRRIRQPLGGDLALSHRLLDDGLRQSVRSGDAARFTFNLWFTTHAICGGFKVCETHLGPHVHSHKDQPVDLSTTLVQILDALFGEMDRRNQVWQRTRGSQAVPCFGTPADGEMASVSVNVSRMREAFRLGHRTLREIWALVLPPSTLLDLKKLAEAPDESFRFPDALWARSVYDFGVAHHLRILARDHLLKSLTALYLGWVASFVAQGEHATPAEVEDQVERLCLAFEAEKRYLISRWRWPDRFNP